MVAVNHEYFERDESLRKARGELAPKLFKNLAGNAQWSNWQRDDGGIVAPCKKVIAPGTTLVRFAGFRAGPTYFAEGAAGGEWWMTWAAYKAIERYADRIGESVAYGVRMVCAVPTGWSDMSYLVQGTTRSELLAYAGRGRSVPTAGGTIDPLAPGKPRIDQLYIPGLSNPDIAKAAVLIHSHAPLDPSMSHRGAQKRAATEAALRERLSRAVSRK